MKNLSSGCVLFRPCLDLSSNKFPSPAINMSTVVVRRSERKDKRLQATFQDGTTIHFGASGASTFVDHADEALREAWIARHKVNEDHGNLKTAGALARHILWEKPSVGGALKTLNARQKTYRFVQRLEKPRAKVLGTK